MATLNITFNGLSADCQLELDPGVADAEVKRLAVEVVRAGELPGLALPDLPDDAFRFFVVDRLQGGARLYLRPKVPFGA